MGCGFDFWCGIFFWNVVCCSGGRRYLVFCSFWKLFLLVDWYFFFEG